MSATRRERPPPIRWVRPSVEAVENLWRGPSIKARRAFDVGADILMKRIEAISSLEFAVKTEGLPSIDGSTPEEELQELLCTAAEIEHGLMIQYLYAANSCTTPALSSIIRQISIEEMGHLLTVENLLLAHRCPPYLGRYDQSSNAFDPFEFHLEPISRGSIAKYAACEMPAREDVDPEERDILDRLLTDATASAGNLTPARVGLLYMKIYWLLRPNDDILGNPAEEPWPGYPVEVVAKMFPDRHVAQFPLDNTLAAQGKRQDWQAQNPTVIILTIERRDDALLAVAQITAQGEGFAAEEDAHFDRFVAAYRQAGAGGTIARPFATDPWYQGVLPRSPEAEITSRHAVNFARLGDSLYEMLLLAIVLALHPDSGYSPEKRTTAAVFSIALMRETLKPLIRSLPALRIRDDTGSPQLSMCFSLPELPSAIGEMQTGLAFLFEQTRALAAMLESTAELSPSLRLAAGTVATFCDTWRDEIIS